MNKITATVTRGNNKGIPLTPHRYVGGFYKVYKGGNKNEFVTKVFDEFELENWIHNGYLLRMSAPGVAPSSYGSKSLLITKY